MILSRFRKKKLSGPAEETVFPSLAFQIIGALFKQHKIRLLAGFVSILTVDLLQLIIPRFIKRGVDSLAAGGATQQSLLMIGGYILCAAFAVAVFRFFWRYLIIGFSRMLEKRVRDQLFSHVLSMDQQFFSRWTTGDLIAHSSNDLNAIQMAFGMGLVAATDALLMSAAAIGFMVAINGQLTLYALLPMPFLAICTRYLAGHMHRRFNRVQEQFSLLTEFARSTIVSIRLIQGYTLEKIQSRQFDQLGKEYVRSNLAVAFIQGIMFPISTLVGNIGMLLVLYKGGSLVVQNQITLGDFVAFTTYLYMLVWPIMAVGWVANLAQRGLTSLRRVHRLLAEQPLVSSETTRQSASASQIVYECKSLCFAYPGERNSALEGLDLQLKPGILGITGRTGSGKSTLCKLLLRLYPVERGMLFFNGVDVNDLAVQDIRNQIGYVAQEPILFSHSIAENINFGQADYDIAAIEQAAMAAAVHDDILQLPGGYDAIVGERGVKLSGGQRQRIALARALLCNRPMLVIDDGLNAIDVETEQQVLQGIRESFVDKTVVLVSHRVNVLRNADQIMIMDSGRMVALGDYESLKNQQLYQAMITKQQVDA